MDKDTLQRAYTWALQHGYDPNLARQQATTQQGQAHMLHIPSTTSSPGPVPISGVDSSGSGAYGHMPLQPLLDPSKVEPALMVEPIQTLPSSSAPVTEGASPDMQQPTVFESMLSGTVPCTPIYNDQYCGVILDANPQAPLHLLIFPKQKAGLQRLVTITDEVHAPLLGHMIVVAKVRPINFLCG